MSAQTVDEALVASSDVYQAAADLVWWDDELHPKKVWVAGELVFDADAIPWPEIAFKTTYWALSDWLRRRHPALRPGDVIRERRHWEG